MQDANSGIAKVLRYGVSWRARRANLYEGLRAVTPVTARGKASGLRAKPPEAYTLSLRYNTYALTQRFSAKSL
jgi:hypothetical protein